jgi:uncharacterized membrane protein
MEKLTKPGRWLLALAVIASGIQQLIRADFVRLVPPLPGWMPGRSLPAVLTGVLLVLTGAAILVDKKTRLAAAVLGGMIFLVLLLYLPGIAAQPELGFVWTNPAKTLALLGGVRLLPGITAGAGTPGRVRTFAAAGFGLFLLICGVQHFVYAGFVMQLVPAWLPAHGFWTYFTGLALIAGGAGMMLPPTARCAAILSGLMIFLWVVLLHVPRALANLHDPGEMSAVFEALALGGVAWLLAGTAKARG